MEIILIPAENDLTHVALSGRLDLDGVKEIEMEFTATVTNPGKPTLVDLSQVTFIASLGMRDRKSVV